MAARAGTRPDIGRSRRIGQAEGRSPEPVVPDPSPDAVEPPDDGGGGAAGCGGVTAGGGGGGGEYRCCVGCPYGCGWPYPCC